MTTTQSGMADVAGAQLYYEVAGQGHPLVLLHAGIADSRMWDEQFAPFAEHYRVVRYDYRGFGKSTMPAGPYSMHEDLFGLLGALGIERAYLVGVSMGGSLAIDFALEHADMVAALVLVACGPRGYPAPEEPSAVDAHFAEIQAAEAAGDLDRANELELHLWVDGLGRTPDKVNPALRQQVRDMNGQVFRRAPELKLGQPQRLEPPAAGRLGDIQVPTLVISGADDLAYLHETGAALAATIPGARRVVMADTAHVPNMEHPAEFNRLVLEFLAGVQR